MLTTRWIGEPSLKLDQVFVVSNSFGTYTPSFYVDTSDVGKLFPMAYPQALPWQGSILSDSDIAILERIRARSVQIESLNAQRPSFRA